jgi:hypothetical protein
MKIHSVVFALALISSAHAQAFEAGVYEAGPFVQTSNVAPSVTVDGAIYTIQSIEGTKNFDVVIEYKMGGQVIAHIPFTAVDKGGGQYDIVRFNQTSGTGLCVSRGVGSVCTVRTTWQAEVPLEVHAVFTFTPGHLTEDNTTRYTMLDESGNPVAVEERFLTSAKKMQ